MTHKITPSVDYNQWLKRLNTQHNKPTNQNSLTSQKLLSQRMKKRYCKTLGTDVINIAPLLSGKSIIHEQFYGYNWRLICDLHAAAKPWFYRYSKIISKDISVEEYLLHHD